MKMEEEQQQVEMTEGEEEELMQQLRSKATELLLREEWNDSVKAYSHFISLCKHISKKNLDPNQQSKLQKSLCLALSNRAEARYRLKDYPEALKDCDQALKIESTHFKSLLCKGKIFLCLSRYSMALDCFNRAAIHAQNSGNSESLIGYLSRCKKLEAQSKTGAFDLSDWVLNGFKAKPPELAEFTGAVEIKKSDISGRGLFATKSIDTGNLLLVTKAIATERGILSDSAENAQLVMWKNFIDKVSESTSKCQKTHILISKLSTGVDEGGLEAPDISLFKPETEEMNYIFEKLKPCQLLNILDVNSLVEESISSKILGKNSEYFGVGLWILASFINHSCDPNVRRLHIGDHLIVHASRDIKAGEEITFPYFDHLLPLTRRREMSTTWGFCCNCKRCKVEEVIFSKQEIKEIEIGIERGLDMGSVVYKLEENMSRCMVKGKEKGYLRASFWTAFCEVYQCDKLLRRWGRRIPTMDVIFDSIFKAVGSDQRVLKVFIERTRKSNNGGLLETEETVVKMARGVYGMVMKKQALRALLELSKLGSNDQSN